MYIAKSYPRIETIQEHTDNLMGNFYLLKEIYEKDIHINWDVLELACLYHDLGKVNRVFQAKLRKETRPCGIDDIPHGYLSMLFIEHRKLMKKYAFNRNDITILVNAVAYHHKRQIMDDDMYNKILAYKDYLIEDAKNFEYEKLPNIKDDINDIAIRTVNKTSINGIKKEILKDYILIKGLLNKIDFAASGYYKVEYKNDFLIRSMEQYKNTWDGSSFNELQNYMIENRDENIIAIAETGYGKTEAGLLWIGDKKGFFTLPLKSAINQTYNRVRNKIVKENIDERVGLLHSDILSEYTSRNEGRLDRDILDYAEITSELSMPLTICTIDQIFDFVYKYIGFERKLATLAYSKLVVDEIQMYSADLVAYIVIALSQIVKLGGKFAIITATFPPFIKDLLVKEGISFKMPEAYLREARVRHSMKIIEDRINSDFILEEYKDNKLLVIVNTVKELNRLYDELRDKTEDINIFHSGFTKRDRKDKEDRIVDFGQRNNEEKGIWICTQVAEASLDIDFDLLITELSDLNGLFQRMGRCYRNRQLDKDYNIYVFDGGEEKCSGIGNVNDEEIYEMSKIALREMGSGTIGEREKLRLINNIYNTDNIKETKYYQEVIQTIEYINSVDYEEFKKSDVMRYFRNINSINVIPEPLYEKNKDYIDRLIDKLKEVGERDNREDLYLEKKRARMELEEFKLSIQYYLVNDKNLKSLSINKYETINIYKCEYDSQSGIRHIKVEEEEEDTNIF